MRGKGLGVLCYAVRLSVSLFYLYKDVFIYKVLSPCFIVTANLVSEYKVSTLYSGTGTVLEFGYVHLNVQRVPYSATWEQRKHRRNAITGCLR